MTEELSTLERAATIGAGGRWTWDSHSSVRVDFADENGKPATAFLTADDLPDEILATVTGDRPKPPERFVPDAFEPDREAPERISMSFARAADQCLRMAVHDREARRSGKPAVVGTVFHDCAAAIGTATVLAGLESPDLERAQSIARNVIRNPDRYDPLPKDSWDDVLELVNKWAQTVTFRPESQFEISSRIEINGRTHSARLDVIAYDETSETVFLTDWKSGRALPAADEASFQGEVYALHAASMFPMAERFVFSEVFVRLGITLPDLVLLRDVDDTAEWLADHAARIDKAYAAGDFPAMPGKHCANCPASLTCPIPDEGRPESKLDSYMDAQSEMRSLLVEDARVAERKKAIRAFLEAKEIEAVEIGGKRLGFKTTESKRLDEKLAKAAGVNLDDFRVVKPSTRFSMTNAKASE